MVMSALERARMHPGGRLGWARNALGALVGIALAGLVTQALIRATGSAAPAWLVAPLGASAVLVFAVPASPLAQPWSVFGGNMISAAIGLALGHAIGVPWAAASLAVGGAIAAMTLARCLHPPGGACALLCALGAQTSHWGWDFLMLPLALNLGLLVLAGSLWNNATGHPWPHRPHPAPVLPTGTWAGTYASADLDAVLAEWDEVLDVDREDLDALFREVEQRVLKRWQAGGG
ncbi:MAG: hypothetical protein RIS94_2079 [Pseudomonadota bacterium]|jgi:CBS domain-containing membrane protein